MSIIIWRLFSGCLYWIYVVADHVQFSVVSIMTGVCGWGGGGWWEGVKPYTSSVGSLLMATYVFWNRISEWNTIKIIYVLFLFLRHKHNIFVIIALLMRTKYFFLCLALTMRIWYTLYCSYCTGSDQNIKK